MLQSINSDSLNEMIKFGKVYQCFRPIEWPRCHSVTGSAAVRPTVTCPPENGSDREAETTSVAVAVLALLSLVVLLIALPPSSASARVAVVVTILLLGVAEADTVSGPGITAVVLALLSAGLSGCWQCWVTVRRVLPWLSLSPVAPPPSLGNRAVVAEGRRDTSAGAALACRAATRAAALVGTGSGRRSY
eukprot:g33598.t1